jgi:sugar/nucleoside kinase (ribokinase family)
MKIVVAGELNPDLIMEGYRSFPALGKEVLVNDLELTMGSASAICAVGLARLGNHVRFIGKVGADPWGDFCINGLKAVGIDTSGVLRTGAVKTGITVSITSARDRALVTYPGSIALLTADEVIASGFDGYRHLHVSSYFLQEKLRPECRRLFAEAHRQGLTTSLDPGYDPSETWGSDLRDTLAEVDVFFPNEVELEAITKIADPERALRALSNSHTVTVAKLGARGCMVLENDRVVFMPAFPVKPIDTTGAGDSFNAGFLHAWLRGSTVEESLRFGAACGAISTQGVGGTGHQATVEQAQDYMREAAHK